MRWRVPWMVGPFAFQDNNTSREFEYPWAFHSVSIHRGIRVVDVGGSLAGFQFVLARTGADVLNIDPGEHSSGLGWPVPLPG